MTRNNPSQQRIRELDDAFWRFHDENPWIYEYMVMLARQLLAAGRRRTSVQLLANKVRWDTAVGTISWDGYKVSQNHTSRYSRLIMWQEPDLEGIFETRTCGADHFDPSRGPRVRLIKRR